VLIAENTFSNNIGYFDAIAIYVRAKSGSSVTKVTTVDPSS
jgi:hypothetical protein